MIRNFKNEDLSDVMDIGNRAWRGIYDMLDAAYGNELFTLITPDRQTVKGEQIKQHCENHSEWIFVCEEEEKIVGFITFFIDKDKSIGEIGNNAVDPDCGLRGIGQQMYKAVLEHFKTQGMLYAKVSTGLDDAHAPARRAYERAGFDIKTENISYFKKLN
jgi:ribosomal protein S18 acetylase RimI-like enzyme